MRSMGKGTGIEPVSFAAWVEERQPAWLRFAYLVTHHEDDARDAVQEGLAAVYARRQQFASTSAAELYLRRCITNAAISQWRRSGRRLVPVADPAPLRAEADGGMAAVDAAYAWQLCAELPPDQRAAVVLRFHEDWSYARIAEVLACPEATARSHVHRALVALRARLQEEHR